MAPKDFKTFGAILLLTALAFSTAGADQTVYDDAIQNGWQDWSWSTNNFQNSSLVHSGSYSIRVLCGGGQALSFQNPAFDVTAYTALTFWINGGSVSRPNLIVKAALGGTPKSAFYAIPTLPANLWQQITVPLYALGVTNAGDMDRFWIQNNSPNTIPYFYVDDISFKSVPASPPGTNFITIDVSANRHAISPEIYGVASGSSNDLVDLNCPVNRLGGNNTSRYNWQANADNRASDWYFESIGDTSSVAGERGDTFISTSKSAGAQPMVTIPMLDWVAKLGSGRGKLASFSVAKYGAQYATDQYFSDAGNGVKPDNVTFITGNDPNDANTPASSAYQQNWVQHITNQWHTATNGGLRYYILDNEHSLWHSTHRDVHPTGATMDEIKNKMVDYATKIKAIDPNAQVVGPEEWGWPGYFYSGADQQTRATNGYSTAPDKIAHGNQDYLPWLLTQLHQTNVATGKRLLDVFSVHYYPQQLEFISMQGNDVSLTAQLQRNRSTRSLWDTNYTDASWINDKVYLVPRIKGWVAANYPGCRTAITEYNWGAESHMNGGTCQADILGIFGRENLDLAARWTVPGNTTPVYKAFKMYRNYDGNKSGFGEMSVMASATNVDLVSVFAAQRTNGGALTVMVINKSPSANAPVSISLTNFTGIGTAQVWQLNTNVISRMADATYTNGVINATLPAQSVTLFVIPSRAARLQAGAPRNDGQFELWLNGETGMTYILQSSTNLTNWSPLSTNTLSSPQIQLLVPAGGFTKTFYRALTS
jgi:hypothetical protein